MALCPRDNFPNGLLKILVLTDASCFFIVSHWNKTILLCLIKIEYKIEITIAISLWVTH